MALYKPGSSSSLSARTEFEILKESHKFLREDGSDNAKTNTWEDKLAQKYYDSLFREYAVCDLKHYKSGNFALRWRTESEVISGAGETTCGNTRCPLHSPRNHDPEDGPLPGLKTLELPFAYVEKGEDKLALVKVVLCDKCCRKLMWKRNKEKEKGKGKQQAEAESTGAEAQMSRSEGVQVEVDRPADARVKEEEREEPSLSTRRQHRRTDELPTRHRSDRSRSPRRKPRDPGERRRRGS
ncbi:folate-sensitive fragile site protein Fra10Ac1-domain-containing protein [Irpex rosettiformis]|uniref:Folate-sensitive fragile site protein Fra10Ac1-domain-containing protein n=1 Tax=Irpex rosettiformis TaxID=378272 RepID=A0ACB8U9L9_9APHY|nr:folate-sensitive fragile site protein Fra10Ac1-domain-containing protein [Irpex rosettiformis]